MNRKANFLKPILCLLLLLMNFNPASLHAAESEIVQKELPVLFQAENTFFDHEQKLLKAWGNVEVFHNGITLKANSITYDIDNDRITIDEGAELYTASGEVIKTEIVEVKSQFEKILVQGLRIYLADESQLAAMGGIYMKDQYWLLNKGSFSPCKFCEDKSKPLTWELKAEQIYYDKKEENIYYYDVTGKFLGVPVFYTPYFSHASPLVKRRSGFLTPSILSNNTLGVVGKIPYYWVIDPSQDLTITPWFSTEHVGVLELEYRKRFMYGEFDFNTSGTYTDIIEDDIVGFEEKDRDFRGHIDAEGFYFLTPNTKLGLDLHLHTDDTYRRVFEIDNYGIIENRAYLEDIRNKNYFLMEILDYDDLRDNKFKKDEPTVPNVFGEFVSDPDIFGGTWHLSGSARTIYREDIGENDQHHAAVKAEWVKNYVFPFGLEANTSLSIQGDVYHVEDLTAPLKTDQHEIEAFLLPIAQFDLRYPLINTTFDDTFIIEPILGFVFTPNSDARAQRIMNEDSLRFELDDTNIFLANRFPGYDRHDIGPRIYYGLEAEWQSDLFRVEGLIGQSYQFDDFEHASLADQKNLDINGFSDIVGRIFVQSDYLDVYYRFLIDNDHVSFRRHDLSAKLHLEDQFEIETTYTYSDVFFDIDDVEFITLDMTAYLDEYWHASFGLKQNFSDDFTPSIYGEVGYEDECFGIALRVEHTDADDRDIDDDLSVMLKFYLKFLGESQVDFE